jgi:hypothetical protein
MAKTRDMFKRAAEPPARGSAVWDALSKALFDPYRPERHYMRGPGPKWHMKHDHAEHLSAQSLGAEHLESGAAHDYRAAY